MDHYPGDIQHLLSGLLKFCPNFSFREKAGSKPILSISEKKGYITGKSHLLPMHFQNIFFCTDSDKQVSCGMTCWHIWHRLRCRESLLSHQSTPEILTENSRQ